MIQINKTNFANSIEIINDGVSEILSAQFEARTDGNVLIIRNKNTERELQRVDFDKTNITINGVESTTSQDAVKKLNEFIGLFNKSAGTGITGGDTITDFASEVVGANTELTIKTDKNEVGFKTSLHTFIELPANVNLDLVTQKGIYIYIETLGAALVEVILHVRSLRTDPNRLQQVRIGFSPRDTSSNMYSLSSARSMNTDLSTWSNWSEPKLDNSLTSTSTIDFLGANQGRILKGLVDALTTVSSQHATDINALEQDSLRILKMETNIKANEEGSFENGILDLYINPNTVANVKVRESEIFMNVEMHMYLPESSQLNLHIDSDIRQTIRIQANQQILITDNGETYQRSEIETQGRRMLINMIVVGDFIFATINRI